MKSKWVLLLLVLTAILCSCSEKKGVPCANKEQCLNDPDCLCWCSQLCNWRKKTPEDHPVYIEDDPNGKHCYCKQWDYDNYEANCVEHKGVEQPPGAK
ncbi:MAG: hypothetical protein JSS30_01205 [Verrucomicrobia bacterium]|nr:hypothetical protein [Verrucomicrobiota bacterium]